MSETEREIFESRLNFSTLLDSFQNQCVSEVGSSGAIGRIIYRNGKTIFNFCCCIVFQSLQCPAGSVRCRRCAHSDYVALLQLHFQYSGESSKNRQILTEHSVKVRPFIFPFTIDKCNLIYFEFAKVFFCTYLSRILRFPRTNAVTIFQ